MSGYALQLPTAVISVAAVNSWRRAIQSCLDASQGESIYWGDALRTFDLAYPQVPEGQASPALNTTTTQGGDAALLEPMRAVMAEHRKYPKVDAAAVHKRLDRVAAEGDLALWLWLYGHVSLVVSEGIADWVRTDSTLRPTRLPAGALAHIGTPQLRELIDAIDAEDTPAARQALIDYLDAYIAEQMRVALTVA